MDRKLYNQLGKIGLWSALLFLSACSSVPGVPFNKDKTTPDTDASVPSDTVDSDIDLAAEATPVVPRILPTDLLGLEAAALDDLLGEVTFVRYEGRGEFRRYKGSGCNLIVVLYPNPAGRTLSTYVDSTAPTSSDKKLELQECLNGF